MNSKEFYLVQFGVSLVVFTLLTSWFLFPRLAALRRETALTWLLLPHSVRGIGLTFLPPAIVNPDFSRSIAQQIAYGDLAIGSAGHGNAALRARAAYAIGLVWLTNIVGFLDIVNALGRVSFLDVRQYDEIGALWLSAPLWIPVLLISHYLIFQRLLRRANPYSVPAEIQNNLPVGA